MEFISRKDGIDKKTIKEYFKEFHVSLETYMNNAKALLNKTDLQFTMEEIDEIGNFYRKYHKNPEEAGLSYDSLLNIFIAYCCEAWRHYFGGEYFDTVSKKDIAYGYPQIIKYGPVNYNWVAISPNGWAFMIEKGHEEPLSLPFRRTLNYFANSPEWNFKTKN